jgi:tetratricopeptide (TPR) repeat protein
MEQAHPTQFADSRLAYHKLQLPEAPRGETGAVRAWEEPVTMLTFLPEAPDRNPMFLEKRVYQGSSGRIYPLPFIDRIATEPADRSWQAVHLENEYLRVMVLPEIGGRIHVGLDKTNGYDFIYRQNVIKPALVGLAGPWISGGIEFNWPQHHRPATFMPTQIEIERHADDSVTVWCSDYDRMSGMKGMHGVCLHPGRAYLELKVRLYNATPMVQTFLWWANLAARVHERYQSFFPPDVRYVADHAKRAITRFPHADGIYYGVNYGERGRHGVPVEELPGNFVPDGSYPPNDLSWYANIPVPTSYMIVGTEEDFFGGYDHAAEAGVVHVANHHIAPGKKQWTWGNHEFGYAWDRSLTEADGPYIELMAGVYTDNQPDFSFLTPGETRVFSQFWYPIRKIGPPQAANLDAALSLKVAGEQVQVGVCVTQDLPDASLQLFASDKQLEEWTGLLQVKEPLRVACALPENLAETEMTAVLRYGGREILRYTPRAVSDEPIAVAVEPPLPEDIETNEELYLTGLHLEQYRHATRRPEPYWREALKRDAGDSRANNALGLWHLRRGEFSLAEEDFRRATARLTNLNPNPRDGEPYYNLGLTLGWLGREAEAYGALYKATWNAAWSAQSYYALARIDAQRGDWRNALEHLNIALRMNTDDLNARNLATVALRKLGREAEAAALLRQTRELDLLDAWSRLLDTGEVPRDNQDKLNLAYLQIESGLLEEAIAVLRTADLARCDGSVPMVLYTLTCCQRQLGKTEEAAQTYAKAAAAPPDYCFPSRIEELLVLEAAIAAHPQDARASYYLGNLLYDRQRHHEAIHYWERAAELDPDFPTVWRNLGLAYFNVLRDKARARAAFDRAFVANVEDARILFERDQLWKRIGIAAEVRLAELERYPQLLQPRDDLAVELATLYNHLQRSDAALGLLESRRFQPWEGGEGLVLGQYVRAHLNLGQHALAAGDPQKARQHFEAALRPPANLGEKKHLLANQSDIYYWLGEACAATEDANAAHGWWKRAASQRGDFQQMSVQNISDMTYWSVLGMQRLGWQQEAAKLLNALEARAEELESAQPRVDYFATSLPAMLVFEEDLDRRNRVMAKFLRSQALLGRGRAAEAEILLQEVLALDGSHMGAEDLLRNSRRLSKPAPVN